MFKIKFLGPLVDSIGLNEDEMQELMLLERPLLELTDEELTDYLLKTHDRLHTKHMAVCVSVNSASK